MLKKYTKNIHLYPINNKFNRNIIECGNLDDILISNISMTNSIYKYYYGNDLLTNNAENIKHIFILNSSIINEEIISFISGSNSDIDFWILLDNYSKPYNLSNNIRYISLDSVDEKIDNIKHLKPNTVNRKLYSNLNIPEKQNQIVYFFNNTKPMSSNEIDRLKGYLYPNTNLKIKLFDNQSFKHYQNLGYVSEIDKRDILLESEYYLFNDPNFYTAEASLCGCKLLDLNQDILNQIDKKLVIDKNSIQINYYDDFIKEICNE